MSCRLGSADDYRGPWYWIGIAINLAYTAGFHRLPPSDSENSPTCHSRLRSQLWWSIYCREAWISFAFSRPMRIKPKEVTTPIPTQVDAATVPFGFHKEVYRKYFPHEINELVRLWLCLVRITFSLGNILTMFSVAKPSGPTHQQIGHIEHEIGAYLSILPDESYMSELMMVHVHQIRLYHEYVVFVLTALNP